MEPRRRTFFNYSPERMKKALDDVRRGVPVATAAKTHCVPRGTLKDKAKGKTPETRRMGPEPLLRKDGEEVLVKWISSLARSGFPVSKDQVLDSAKKMMEALDIQTNSLDGRPSRSWFNGFLKRNPSVSIRVAENLTISRASVTAEQLESWSNSILEYLKENCYDNILCDPTRVFNGDETAFLLNPKGSKVLAPKGDRSIYQQVNSDEKECITVLITASAAGIMAPPLLVFKYERIPADIAASVPSNWGIGKSESGWMTSALFYEFIANVFHPWLLEKGIEFPVILFVDGHSSHLTLHTSEFCDKNGIILVALYPNATHLIQPMDVAVFRSLKGKWQKKVQQWRLDNINYPVLKKKDFSPLLEEVLNDINPCIIQNGFKACGIVPWNPKAVKLTRPNGSDEEVNVEVIAKSNVQKKKDALMVLEDAIGVEKVNLFKRSDTWEGSNEDTSLFKVWQKIRNAALAREDLPVGSAESVTATEGHQREQASQSENEMGVSPLPCTPTASIPTNTPQPSTSTQASIFTPRTPEKSKCSHSFTIPSPFKRALFFPETAPKRKKNKKEVLPSVITSQSWRNYHENKAKKKLEEEENKKKRAEERAKKREEKEKLKKKKEMNKKKPKTRRLNRTQKEFMSSSEDEVWMPSGSSDDGVSE